MKNTLLVLFFLVSNIGEAQTIPQIWNRWGINDSIYVNYSNLISNGSLRTYYSYNWKFTIDSNLQIGFYYSSYDTIAGIWHPNRSGKWSGDTLREQYLWDPLLNQYKPYWKNSMQHNSDGCQLSQIDSIYDPLTLSWNYELKREYFYKSACELDSIYYEVLPSAYNGYQYPYMTYTLYDSVGSFRRVSYYSYEQTISAWNLNQQSFRSSTGDTMSIEMGTNSIGGLIDTTHIRYKIYDNGGNEINITERWDPFGGGKYISDSVYFVSTSSSVILKENYNFDPPSSGGGLYGQTIEQWVYSNNQLDYRAIYDSSNQLIRKTDLYYFPNGYVQKYVELTSNGSALDTTNLIEIEHYTINNIGYNEALHQSILIAPNPADDNIRIIGIDEVFNYQLVSIDGRIVKEGFVSEKISVEELPEGVYSIILISGSEQYRTKFLKL